jgi:hypothetical protein
MTRLLLHAAARGLECRSLLILQSRGLYNAISVSHIGYWLSGQKKELEMEVDNVVVGSKPTRKIRCDAWL